MSIDAKAKELGIQLIKEFEGCKLKAYICPAGRITIGWGSTQAGTGIQFQLGETCTQLQADQWLAQTVEKMAGQLEQALAQVPVALSNTQSGALLDFVYNLGIGNLKKSGLLRALMRGDLPTAADQFLLWNKIGSYASPGLTRRREAERAMFLSVPTKNPQ